MNIQDYDLTRWRKKLAHLRAQCMTFEQAWNLTVGVTARSNGGEETVLRFIYRHWEAAYTRSPAPLGRSGIPTTEAGGTGTRVPVSDRKAVTLCRSGVEGGCGKRALHGRFGPTFCKAHFDELVPLRMDGPEPPRALNLAKRAA